MREVRRTWSDTERAGRELGYRAGGVGLDERIAVQVEWTPEEGLAHSLTEGGSAYVKVQLS